MAESPQPRPAEQGQLLKRVLVIVVLLPLGLAAMYAGGIVFACLIAIVLGLAAYEFSTLFRRVGYQPAEYLAVAGVIFLVLAYHLRGLELAMMVISLFILLSMIHHLLRYEMGRDQAGSDFSITLSALVYVGLGVFLVVLRDLQDGIWWLLIVLLSVWLADIAAYLIGVKFGRHKMTIRLSPKKSWEGYLSGILFSIIGIIPIAWLFQNLGAGVSVTPVRASILAALISVLSIFGDLGESMIKRQVGVKDSSNLLPGHGGFLDRIDTWLWAAVIGYFTVSLFFL